MVNPEYQPPYTIIVPAFNEEDAIADLLNSLKKVLEGTPEPIEILVINDGSTDRTAEAATREGAIVLNHSFNRGYGASLKTGILAASQEVIVILDADNTYPVEKIPGLVDQLQDADMVVGARTGEEVKVPWVRQPAKYFLRKLAARIAGQPIPDLNSGLRAFRRNVVQQYFSILPDGFSFTTTITLAYLADGYRINYLPINYRSRTGKSKIVPWHFMDFLILILRLSMMFNPLRVFLPLAFFFGCMGVLKSIYDVAALFFRAQELDWSLLLQPVLSTSAVLLLFIGMQFLMIGMVADGVIRRIAQQNKPLVPSHSRRNPKIYPESDMIEGSRED